MKRYRWSLGSCAFILGFIGVAVPAFAGPPLLCHAYDIGGARSLPWVGQTSWFEGSPDYKLDRLVADTEALLTPSTPVIVRMETLRRAAIYASADAHVAAVLVKRLLNRAEASEIAGRPDGLAYLDAAYFAGALNEIAMLAQWSKDFETKGAVAKAAVGGIDAYGLILKSVAARPGDATVQFAAALISNDGHRAEYAGHAAKARAGAASDMLLARNLDHVQ